MRIKGVLLSRRITKYAPVAQLDRVTDSDVSGASSTILSEMGELCPPDPMPNPMYRTKAFMEFLIDSIEVDVMAGFAIVHEGTVYDCSLREDQIVEKMLLGTEVIPLQSPRLWCKYYRLNVPQYWIRSIGGMS